jgi:hypothetical protein
MTYVAFLGGLMTTFSVPTLVLFLTLRKYPFLILLFMAGAFFWIFGALLKASLWMAFQDSVWGAVITGVVVDGGCRVCFAWSYTKWRPKLALLMGESSRGDINKTMNYRSSSLAAGLGYGTIQAAALYGLALSEATGPATYYLTNCPNISIFLLQAAVSLCFLCMAPFLQYAAMHAVYHQKWVHVAPAVGLHALAAVASISSTSEAAGMCVVSVVGAAVALAGSVLYSVCVLHGKGASATEGERAARAKLL